MTTCKVVGCEKKVRATGFCMPHYMRNKRYGSPDISKHNSSGEGGITNGYKTYRIDGKLIYEHVLKAEQVLNKKLPTEVIIHHVDGDNLNNENSNLVICPNQAYHLLIHARMRLLKFVESGGKLFVRDISRTKAGNRWYAYLVVEKTRYWLGSFTSFRYAVEARIVAAQRYLSFEPLNQFYTSTQLGAKK